MNQKIIAAKTVAARLFPAENSIDEALIANASLQIALLAARREAQEPCGSIQDALDGTVISSQALMEARRAIVSTHAEIVQLRDKLGLPNTGYGCETPCSNGFGAEAKPHLQVA